MKLKTAFALLVATMAIDSRFDVVASSSSSSSSILDGSDPQATRKTRRVLNEKNKNTCQQEQTMIAALKRDVADHLDTIKTLRSSLNDGGGCTGLHEDPNAPGNVGCCDGLHKVKKQWDGPNSEFRYQCENKKPCVGLHGDPYPHITSPHPTLCCQGLEKKYKEWVYPGHWSYQCEKPEKTCAGLHEDPNAPGNVGCCDGLHKVKKQWDGPNSEFRYQCENKTTYSCKPIFDQRADGRNPNQNAYVIRDPSKVEGTGQCDPEDEPGCNRCKSSIWEHFSDTPGDASISNPFFGVASTPYCHYSASMLCQDVLDSTNVAPVKMKDIVSVDFDVEVYGCLPEDTLALFFFDAHKAKGDNGYTKYWDIKREPDPFEVMAPAGTVWHNWAGSAHQELLKAPNSVEEILYVSSGTKENPMQKHLSFTQKRGSSTRWDSYGCDKDKVRPSGRCPIAGESIPGWSHGYYSNVPDINNAGTGCDVECSSSSNKECCHAIFIIDNWSPMTAGCHFTITNMIVETSAPNSYENSPG